MFSAQLTSFSKRQSLTTFHSRNTIAYAFSLVALSIEDMFLLIFNLLYDLLGYATITWIFLKILEAIYIWKNFRSILF